MKIILYILVYVNYKNKTLTRYKGKTSGFYKPSN